VQSAINQLRTLISEQPNLYSGRMALAQILINTGRWAEAVEQTRQARQLAPRSIDAVLLDVRARLQMLADNQTSRDSPLYRDIEATLDNLDKVSDGAVEVKLLQVRLAVLKNNLPRAEELLADLKKANPSESRVVLAQADLFVAQNKVDDAIALLREKVVALPRSTAVLKYLVALLAAKNERQECETLVKNAIASETTEYTKKEMELLLCDIYGRWSEDAKRCALLNSLAEQLKDDISVLRELLTCEDIYKGAGRAQQVIDKIKSIEGDDGWQWRYEQAKVWFAQEDFKNRYPQIVSLLQENLRANPDDQPSRMLLAASYEKGGDMRLAVSTYTEALNRSPRDVRIIVPAVAALYRSGEYDRADEILKQAAKEKLRHPDLERLEVQGAIRRGDLDSANNTMEKVLARDPNNLSTVLSLALLKIRQNDLADAQKLVTALRTREPNSLSVAAIQVDLDIRSGRSEEALRLCDEMVRKLNSVSSLLLRGRAYAVIGKLDSAGEDFQRAVTMEPNNADAWVAKGLFHQTHGQADKAIADVRQAMSALPDNLQIQKAAITIYMASENSDLRKEGESILEKALVTNPDDIELRLRKAQTLLAKGTAPGIEQATAILQSITESRPQVADAWALLARAALQEGKSAKAIDACLRGLVHSPNDKTLLLLKAEAEAASSPELALPTMKALWELDTNNIETAVSLAELYIAAGQYDNAINLLGKQPVSANASQQRKINLALAVALHKNGSKSESDEIIKGLSESGPNDVRLLLTRLRLLRDDKSWPRLKEIVDDWCEKNFSQTQTAVYIFDELSRSKEVEGRQMAEEFSRCVLKNDENSAVLMMRLGTLLQASGRTSEAAVLYKRVLDKQADDLIAINNLAWILCEDQKNPQEALELAQRGLKKAPEYVDLLDTRGRAFDRLGRFGDAAEDFKKCVSLYPAGAPGRVSSHFHLGRSLADLGEKNQAIEQLNRAIELNKEVGALDGSDLAEAHKLLEKLTGGK
jgi:tetratricopeptide (TPR) repeat protein